MARHVASPPPTNGHRGLKEYRLAHKMSMREIAEHLTKKGLHMTADEWCRYENGIRAPEKTRAAELARLTGISLAAILGVG